MVAELIVDHDSVALPGVGTFVAAEVPASFSDRGFTINPPYRKLSFMLGGVDDGLLSDLYARSNSVDPDAAKAILSHFLAEMKEVLKDTKALVLPGLGRLRATRDNTFFFVPDEDIAIYPDGFGLPPVSLKNTGSAMAQPAGSGVAVPPDGPLTQLSGPPVAAATPEPEILEPEEPVSPEEWVKMPPKSATDSAEKSGKAKETGKKKRWWVPFVVIAVIAVLALAAFLVLARVAPDFIDSILYTPEELKIINS